MAAPVLDAILTNLTAPTSEKEVYSAVGESLRGTNASSLSDTAVKTTSTLNGLTSEQFTAYLEALKEVDKIKDPKLRTSARDQLDKTYKANTDRVDDASKLVTLILGKVAK